MVLLVKSSTRNESIGVLIKQCRFMKQSGGNGITYLFYYNANFVRFDNYKILTDLFLVPVK